MGDTPKILNDIVWNSLSSNKFITSPSLLNFAPPCGGRFCLSQDLRKNTRIRHWAAKHVGVMQSCCCQMQDMFLYSTLHSNMKTDTDPIGFFIVITNDCNFLGSFSDFVSEIDVALPIHKWFQDLPWFLYFHYRPSQHGTRTIMRPQPTSDCSASCIEDASLSWGDLPHSQAG